jgi:glycosyltransferase involved in cell wall biosynthesis
MRIVIANRFFSPDESGASRMVTSLAFGLARRGHEVHVVTGRRLRDRPGRLAPRERLFGVTVHRVWTTPLGRDRLYGRAVDYVLFHLGSAWRMRRLVRRGDLVIACTDPPLLSVNAMLATAGSGAALVNWLHDLFPEAAVRLGVVNENGLFVRIISGLRDVSLRRARRNVTPIPRMADYLAGRGIRRSSFTVMRQWSDGGAIVPVDPGENTLRREWGLRDRFVVGYSGNFGRVHDFATMLQAAELLRGLPEIVFLFIGGGQRRAWVEAEVRRRRLGNVLMKPFQPRERLGESLGAADVHLVSLLPDLEVCSIPSKFYGILAAGRPTLFIGDPEGEIAQTIRQARCGAAVRLGDGEGLAEHISGLAHSEAGLRNMGACARSSFERAFAEDAAIDAWEELLFGLSQPVAGLSAAAEQPIGAPSEAR